MNARVVYVLNSIKQEAEGLVLTGAILSLILVPMVALILDIPISLTTLSIGTAILYIVGVILYYSNQAKKEVN
jgi:hypothetical protein